MTAALLREPAARARAAVRRAFDRCFGTAVGRYQAAAVRIGFAGCFAAFLLREWPHRRILYGPSSPWGYDLFQQLDAQNHAFTVLSWSGSAVWFEAVYTGAIAVSVLFALGWRTRTMSVLFMTAVLAVQNRAAFISDGGDNVLHLMAVYLVFVRCGTVWSLDARRARRRAGDGAPDRVGIVLWCGLGPLLALLELVGFARVPWQWNLVYGVLWAVQGLWWLLGRRAPDGEPRAVCAALSVLVHNAAMLVTAAQVCLIYATAGWYKVQGDKWQDGTAVWYPLKLEYFRPWPWLSDALSASSLVLLLLAYGSVAVQVAFPFTVFHRRLKNVLLVLMIGEHLGIAVVLGLPFFSLAMITADALFLPTALLRYRARRRAADSPRIPGPSAEPSPEPLPEPSSGRLTLDG